MAVYLAIVKLTKQNILVLLCFVMCTIPTNHFHQWFRQKDTAMTEIIILIISIIFISGSDRNALQ